MERMLSEDEQAPVAAPVGQGNPLLPICDELSMRLTWASAVVWLIVRDPDAGMAISDAAGAAEERLRKARKTVKKHRKAIAAKPSD